MWRYIDPHASMVWTAVMHIVLGRMEQAAEADVAVCRMWSMLYRTVLHFSAVAFFPYSRPVRFGYYGSRLRSFN